MSVLRVKSNLTAEERKARAQKAIKARWLKEAETGGTLKALYTGTLVIGDMSIPCAVLEDGTRVISETGIRNAFDSRGSFAVKIKQKYKDNYGADLPVFLAAEALKPLIINKLSSAPFNIIKYKGA